MQTELIVKYLIRQLTEEESALLVEWLESDNANRDFLFGLEELYWADRIEEWQRLADTDREWKKLEKQIRQPSGEERKKKRALLTGILRYAAILAVAVSLPFAVYKTGLFTGTKPPDAPCLITIDAGKGERSQVTLPDGTKVWINSCSSLTYHTEASAVRRVQLTGEAYFEVIKNDRRPFIVSTPLLDVKVLGTKFNLKAFEEENSIQATLYEGLIAANIHNRPFDRDFLLNPGEQLTYEKDKKPMISTVQGQEATDWKNGIFRFHKRQLQDIVRALERSFAVEITIADAKLAQERFTCEFRNEENVVDILNVLKKTKKLDFRIKGSIITVFSKNKTK
ncbi:MAG: DUF4974 domain-containing protein [Dysgonamonadaceae bacterium]|jgi:ferric-dicitrate binding protein FerR (iron transport regulator)|nr:DUF4974 domain-containing protein [Dysgonamonadaceae bacterium]